MENAADRKSPATYELSAYSDKIIVDGNFLFYPQSSDSFIKACGHDSFVLTGGKMEPVKKAQGLYFFGGRFIQEGIGRFNPAVKLFCLPPALFFVWIFDKSNGVVADYNR